MDGHRLPSADMVAPRAWAGLAVVAAASFVATLDAMVLYVAFGNIRRDFPEVTAAALSWILSGYTIVIAAGAARGGPPAHCPRRAPALPPRHGLLPVPSA